MRGDPKAIFGNLVSEDEKACNLQSNSLSCCVEFADSLMRSLGVLLRTYPFSLLLTCI